ncbi:hypothetical protein AJ79_09370 [Helicocarpus griseus UAMH5409]|uniref:Dihydrofolate reductase n=1 Tax=Helicocarpus griseus UAMH5409 TaxID=1447875 RepID=A0A2B7WKH7_9EURO|nr:hypothetical protein AJ79_09370 [Helicocarpus griseus UAMH5409]
MPAPPPDSANMPSSPTTSARALLRPLPPLTLIVATTPITASSSTPASRPNHDHHSRRLGIGHAGTLPWPRIKTDMTFFSRVTTRAPPPLLQSQAQSQSQSPNDDDKNGITTTAVNAVIMGRKTYDSLPARFRPLPGRVNVVVSRDGSGALRQRVEGEWWAAREREERRRREAGSAGAGAGDNATEVVEEEKTRQQQHPDVLVANSLEGAVTALCDAFATGGPSPTPGPLSRNATRCLANVFVIGGGEIYASALKLGNVAGEKGLKLRIVMTDVRRVATAATDSTGGSTVGDGEVREDDLVDGFECDTYFPIDNDELEQGEGGKWRRVSAEETSAWVGEEVKDGWIREGDVVLRILGYERT